MAESKTATEGQLGELHQKVAKVMSNALDRVLETQDAGGIKAGDDGELVEIPLNPALLSVVTKFLAENKITCAPETGNHMSELEGKLAERASKRRRVGHLSVVEDAD